MRERAGQRSRTEKEMTREMKMSEGELKERGDLAIWTNAEEGEENKLERTSETFRENTTNGLK